MNSTTSDKHLLLSQRPGTKRTDGGGRVQRTGVVALGEDGGRLEWIDRRNDNNPSAAVEGEESAASFFLSFSGAFSSASPAAFWMPPALTALPEKTLANLFVFSWLLRMFLLYLRDSLFLFSPLWPHHGRVISRKGCCVP